ncbi:MAG: hypothetical protein HY775_01160 [Acidobacteria bacterium]|nr:hypothetical protein [Acidobacteriota bacterium]
MAAIVAAALGAGGAAVVIAGGGGGDNNFAVFNDDDPPAQRHAVGSASDASAAQTDNQAAGGGAYVGSNAARNAALAAARAHGESAARVVRNDFVTYGEARKLSGRDGLNASMGDDREVYFVVMEGKFTFNRGPRGVPSRAGTRVYVIIDAPTGDIMEFGELV